MRVRPGRLSWKLFFGNAALMAAVLLGCLWLIIGEFQRFHSRELIPYLRSYAAALTPLVEGRFALKHSATLDQLAKECGTASSGMIRVTLVAADGTVLGDSHADPAAMESHADRPEIVEALRAGWGTSRRWSATVKRDMQYVAVRLGPAGRASGVIRAAMAVARIDARTASSRRLMWALGLMALLAGVLLALGIIWLWSGRVARVTATARSLLGGDLTARVDESGSDEVALLARALNRLRERIAAQLAQIDRHRRGLEALLEELHEGVVVADSRGRIVLVNPAARRLLRLDGVEGPTGVNAAMRTVEQCVPQHDLQRLLIGGAGSGGAPREAAVSEVRIELPGEAGAMTVLARASDIALPESPQRVGGGNVSSEYGRLLVLTDVTELMRTVKMKTDFVANASHELRTPLSAIRAAVETLTKTDPTDRSGSAARCLEVIARHANRLEQLVSDLLDLSRVEAGAGRFRQQSVNAVRFCSELQGRWQEGLTAKRLEWVCEVADDCRSVVANPYLLQLVLDNLVDNAIKFSGTSGRIVLRWSRDEAGVGLEVEDSGCGIPASEQQRVFERFYQVSPSRAATTSGGARTRGTGLGLSIVRHAVVAMGGAVELTSQVGVGTKVRVRLPASGPAERDLRTPAEP